MEKIAKLRKQNICFCNSKTTTNQVHQYLDYSLISVESSVQVVKPPLSKRKALQSNFWVTIILHKSFFDKYLNFAPVLIGLLFNCRYSQVLENRFDQLKLRSSFPSFLFLLLKLMTFSINNHFSTNNLKSRQSKKPAIGYCTRICYCCCGFYHILGCWVDVIVWQRRVPIF